MALPAPINWPAVRAALMNWFTGATSLNTVWHPAAVPGNYPHAVLEMTGPAVTGGDSVADEVRTTTDLTRPAGQEVGQEAVGPRRIGVICRVYVDFPEATDPTQDPRHHLSIAQSSLGLPSTLDTLAQAGLANFARSEVGTEITDINGASIVVGTLVIGMSLASTLVEYTGYVSSTRITSDELGAGNNLVDEVFGETA